MSSIFQQAYEIVKKIPCGAVTTYGQIALLLGNPRMSRVVGYALNCCRDPAVPCHRVVNRLGGLSAAFEELGVNRQRLMLEEEGVEFTGDGRANLTKFMWYGG